jgi:hypothetical protein
MGSLVRSSVVWGSFAGVLEGLADALERLVEDGGAPAHLGLGQLDPPHRPPGPVQELGQAAVEALVAPVPAMMVVVAVAARPVLVALLVIWRCEAENAISSEQDRGRAEPYARSIDGSQGESCGTTNSSVLVLRQSYGIKRCQSPSPIPSSSCVSPHCWAPKTLTNERSAWPQSSAAGKHGERWRPGVDDPG